MEAAGCWLLQVAYGIPQDPSGGALSLRRRYTGCGLGGGRVAGFEEADIFDFIEQFAELGKLAGCPASL
eukprot:9335185-Alexandrium_andersonii.AAC.1